MTKAAATLALLLTLYSASADAAADKAILCKMYFVSINWLHERFPTQEDLEQCVKDPAKWRESYLGKSSGSSGGFRGGGSGPSGPSGRSGEPDVKALGLCLDAILETKAFSGRTRLNLTESQTVLDGETTIVDGKMEYTDTTGAVSGQGFHCEVEGRRVANLTMRNQ